MRPWNFGIKRPDMSGDRNPSRRADVREKIREKAKGNNNGFKHGLSRTNKYRVMVNSRRRTNKIGNGGCHTIAEWDTLKAQYNWTCLCCGRNESDIKLEVDHIIPLVKGGSDNIENIQPLCRTCNAKKYTKIISYKIKNEE